MVKKIIGGLKMNKLIKEYVNARKSMDEASDKVNELDSRIDEIEGKLRKEVSLDGENFSIEVLVEDDKPILFIEVDDEECIELELKDWIKLRDMINKIIM